MWIIFFADCFTKGYRKIVVYATVALFVADFMSLKDKAH